MNIQIFGRSKCFDTKKAERYFKERKIKVSFVDLLDKGLSKGELTSVVAAVGLDNLANEKNEDYVLFAHLLTDGKFNKLLDNPRLLKTPIVRNGKTATVGYAPDVWKNWE